MGSVQLISKPTDSNVSGRLHLALWYIILFRKDADESGSLKEGSMIKLLKNP